MLKKKISKLFKSTNSSSTTSTSQKTPPHQNSSLSQNNTAVAPNEAINVKFQTQQQRQKRLQLQEEKMHKQQKEKLRQIEKKKQTLLRQARRSQQDYHRSHRNRSTSRERDEWHRDKRRDKYYYNNKEQQQQQQQYAEQNYNLPDPNLQLNNSCYLKDGQKKLIKERYLGKSNKFQLQEKKRRFNQKYRAIFNFKWDEKEDTSRDQNPLYSNRQDPNLLFGRGTFGGIQQQLDGKGQKYYGGLAYTIDNYIKNTLQDQKTSQDKRQQLRKGVVSLSRDHWSFKTMHQMNERDWRIFREDHNIFIKGGMVPHPIRSWSESNLPDFILNAIEDMAYKAPSGIQMQAIPIGIQAKDMIGLAPTGSGKSAAFLIPLIYFLHKLPPCTGERATDGPYAIVLAPSRELANQIDVQFKKLAKYTKLRSTAVIGGKIAEDQGIILSRGVQVLVGTPGRILDCIDRSYLVLNQVSWVILDQADKMIDDGFQEQVNQILDCIPEKNMKSDQFELNDEAQLVSEGRMKFRVTSMFSATMPRQVENLAKKYLRSYSFITIGQPSSGKKDIQQRVEFVSENGKYGKLRSLLKCTRPPIMIFVTHKKETEQVGKYLERLGWSAASLHGNKSQNARQAALKNFRDGKVDVLVCTDLAGRGIDVEGIQHVINFDAPKNIRDYTHRIGRTGRAGNKGLATTLLTAQDQDLLYDLRQFLYQMNQHVPSELGNHPAAKSKPGGPMVVARRKQIVFAT